MATYDEIAAEYKNRVQQELGRSSALKTSAAVTESSRRQRAASVFTEIWQDLSQYTKHGLPLDEPTKKQILAITGQKLGLVRPETFYIMVKEASNDNLVALVNYWDAFFSELDRL